MRWVGLVRNVMLGREGLHRDRLLTLVREAGGTDPVSVITTGNVLFTAPEEDMDRVLAGIEQAISAVIGRAEPMIVRPHDWLRTFTERDPFTAEQHAAEECEVGFLSHRSAPIDPARVPRSGRTTVVAVHERELVTARPRAGPNRPHVNRLLEDATGSPTTSRGWATLVRLANRE